MQMQFALKSSDDPVAEAFGQRLQAFGVCYGPGWPDKFGNALERWTCQNRLRGVPTLSLFSGAGGLDIGFRQAGFDIKVAVEIEEKFTATLKSNVGGGSEHGGTKILTTDIRDYEPSYDDGFEFVIGGPPCQTFSAAGRRAGGVIGTSDDTGALFKEYVRLLSTINPKGFLFENVYGITGAGKGNAWKEIQAAFEDIGYNITSRVLDTADYGVPQHRDRLFIVGLREGNYEFPTPVLGPDAPGQPAFYSAKEAIGGVSPPSPEDPLSVGGRYGHLLDNIPPGLNYSFYTEKLGHPHPVFSWRSKFSDFLYKADPDVPVRTLKARGGLYTGPFHWDNRPFTITELKRLQTFPDDYVLAGGRQAIIEQIGNSVPPQMARILALSIIGQVFRMKGPMSLPTLPPNVRLGFRRRKRERTNLYVQKAALALKESKSEAAERQSVPHHRTYRAVLSKGFGWVETRDQSVGMPVRVSRGDTGWEILLESPGQRPAGFEIEIRSAPGQDWGIAPAVVTLKGQLLDKMEYTSAWKAFEHELISSGLKGDLVQLCGYYQYQPSISARLRLDEEPPLDSTWTIVQRVVSGVGVRQPLPISSMADLWEVTQVEAVEAMHFLKNLGYEVRNDNTNPQIPSGWYLIPYVFPSLTPMSVQLRKSLGTSEGK